MPPPFERAFPVLFRSRRAHEAHTNAREGPSTPDEAANVSMDTKVPTEHVNTVPLGLAPNLEAQEGVTNAEAVTLSWSKTSLGSAYVL